MLNQIPEAIKKSSRLLTMRHPNSVDAKRLDYVNDEDIAACIEPLDETAFKPQKNDRVFWIEAAFVKAFQIEQVISPLQMPSSRLAVYHLISIEQPYDFTESTV